MNRRYLLSRIAQAVVTILAVITISFGMIRLLPGDPRTFLAAMAAGQGQADVDPDVYLEDGAYDPGDTILEQYVSYVAAVLQGDLGTSTFVGEPVAAIIADALPWTIFLVALALPITFAIGIVFGSVLAYWEGSSFDVIGSSSATLLNSIPYYIAAVLMVYLLGYQSSLFPHRGRYPPAADPGLNAEFILGALHHAALPVASIVITSFGFRALAMRGNSIQILGEDFVRVAKLRGLRDRRIALQYVGRNAVLPIYTEFMIAIGVVLGGTIILEEIFQYEGLGFWFYMAINSRDYPLMMGAFLVITITTVIGLFVADLSYGLIDPRASAGDRSGMAAGASSVSRSGQVLGFVRWLRSLPSRLALWIRRGVRRSSDGRRDRASVPTSSSGGSVFEATADVSVSRRRRLSRALDEYVLAPARIIWTDARARVGLAIILLYVLMGTMGVWTIERPSTRQGDALVPAFQTTAHPLGTGLQGRDLLGMVVHSTPAMLEMMLAGAVVATVFATLVGLVAGYSGGSTDRYLMLISDITLAIPGLPLVMVLAVIFEPTAPWAVGVLLSVNAWGGTARQIRSQVLTIREESYVEASGIMSLGRPTILLKDVLPNVVPFIFVRAVDMARLVIILSVALYFLGVLPFRTLNWGVMLNQAYQNGALLTTDAASWILVPTAAISLFIYGLILFAQGTERVFNPRVRTKHAETADVEEESATMPAPGDD